MICTGGPYGDCMRSFDVILEHEYTVKEFVEEVIKEKPQEWGEVVITTDFKYIYSEKEDSCTYKYGEIKENFKGKKTESRTIVEMKASGGWTTMNYYIKCK